MHVGLGRLLLLHDRGLGFWGYKIDNYNYTKIFRSGYRIALVGVNSVGVVHLAPYFVYYSLLTQHFHRVQVA